MSRSASTFRSMSVIKTHSDAGAEALVVVTGTTPFGHTVLVEEVIPLACLSVPQNSTHDAKTGKTLGDALDAGVLVGADACYVSLQEVKR